MKEKISQSLKTKYSNLGFGQKAFDGVADYLSKTVTDETQIETAISGVEPLLKAFQSDIDRMRTEKSALQTKLDELEKAASAKGGAQNKTEPDNHLDAEAIKAELLKTLREEQAAAIEQSKQAAQRAASITSKAKEYGIPEKFATKFNIPSDANLDEFFKATRQELVDAGFEFSEPPMQGGGMPDNGSDIAKLINTGTEEIVKSKKS